MLPITIIIPSYNRSLLLDKTLCSFTSQSVTTFQIIIIDHGSIDETKEVFKKYKEKLDIKYFLVERNGNSPGIPRDFGARRADSHFLLFLDCGTIVPSFYVAAHIALHQCYSKRVGLGFCHGHKTDGPQDDRWNSILKRIDIDEADREPELCDERVGLNLVNLNLPWLYGWTGNMSMHTEDYWSVGGFDPEQEYGFEDLDFSYRLFKHGLQFTFVENGWGIHLPHPRASNDELEEMEHINWQRSYWKHRSLALETIQYAGMNFTEGERAFEHLTKLGQNYIRLPSVSGAFSRHFSRPSLLVGGAEQDAPYYDHIALANEDIISTDSIWSCSGILIPLADFALETVVVSDVWRWMSSSFNTRNISLLECLISEIKRTARKAFFINSSSISIWPDSDHITVPTLKSICHKYDLSFQILSLG